MKNYTAIDIANFFIDLSNKSNDEMTNLRVNKLLYFAQGWFLAKYGTPLFNDSLEAWDFGPVVPKVYQTFQPCGKNQISTTTYGYNNDSIETEVIDFLLDVYTAYSIYSTSHLVQLSHDKNSPWSSVYEPYCNKVISLESLKEYFKSLNPLEQFKSDDIPESLFEGYRDSDGLLVLPKELDYA